MTTHHKNVRDDLKLLAEAIEGVLSSRWTQLLAVQIEKLLHCPDCKGWEQALRFEEAEHQMTRKLLREGNYQRSINSDQLDSSVAIRKAAFEALTWLRRANEPDDLNQTKEQYRLRIIEDLDAQLRMNDKSRNDTEKPAKAVPDE